jgi:hypothetical protein
LRTHSRVSALDIAVLFVGVGVRLHCVIDDDNPPAAK